MHLDLPRAVRARLDPDERFGLRLSLVAIAVLVVAIPFAYLTFEVLGAGPLTRLDARVANDLNAWAYQRQNLVRGLEAVSLLAKPITLWLIAGAAVLWLWRPSGRGTRTFRPTARAARSPPSAAPPDR